MRANRFFEIIHRRWAEVATVLIACGFLALVVILSINANMIADDFRFLQPHFPIMDFMYNRDSGRLAHGIALTVMSSLFGEESVKIFPIFIVTLFIASIGGLFYSLRKTSKSFCVGVIVAILFIFTLHSFFDFSLFFSAATTHTLALIYLINLATLYVYLSSKREALKIYHYLGLFIFCLFGGLFSEMSALLASVITVLFIILSRLKTRSQSNNPQSYLMYFLAITANITSFFVIYFSPGSSSRRATNSLNSDLLSSLSGSVSDYISIFTHFLNSAPSVMAIVISGLLIYSLITSTKYSRITLLIVSAFLILTPVIILFITNYSLGYTAMRIFNIADFFVFLSLTILFVVFLSFWNTKKRPKASVVMASCIILTIVPFMHFFTTEFAQIHEAQLMRAEVLNARNKLKENHSNKVSFMPAPLLLKTSEAIDMTFYPNESPNSTWLYMDLLSYYKIDPNRIDISIAEQPIDYCIKTDILSRFKEVLAKKCESY